MAQSLKILTAIRWSASGNKAKPVDYPGVIISLTSYRARFATLSWTLKCLLLQSARPRGVILWVGHNDRMHIPDEIENLKVFGLEIRATDDIGPYTKIIPALLAFPTYAIVTADDDIYYPRDWLASLIQSWSGSDKQIVCHRAHKIKLAPNKTPLPYNQWEPEIKHLSDSDWLFPTGVGGVLYPSNSLHQQVTNVAVFESICPKADDVWLYWMGRMNNAVYKKTEKNFGLFNWPNSQSRSLSSTNVIAQDNDRQIENMLQQFPISFAAG